ncbi:type II toxin-antitoxin system RelE/ParE family toxin [Fibrella sp. WM1]|uniref:type II toxin-antitoxin system RelE/ParE family toxin n=1 Tax=Fibrella musci TaxID=3242485 RepID=UPI003520211D
MMRVVTAQQFEKEAKRLIRKYRSLGLEIKDLIDSLAENPTQGTSIGRNCYKIRLAIRSKGQGKRGGARVITCVVALTETVTLLSIYDKAEQSTISDKELELLLIANDLA